MIISWLIQGRQGKSVPSALLRSLASCWESGKMEAGYGTVDTQKVFQFALRLARDMRVAFMAEVRSVVSVTHLRAVQVAHMEMAVSVNLLDRETSCGRTGLQRWAPRKRVPAITAAVSGVPARAAAQLWCSRAGTRACLVLHRQRTADLIMQEDL